MNYEKAISKAIEDLDNQIERWWWQMIPPGAYTPRNWIRFYNRTEGQLDILMLTLYDAEGEESCDLLVRRLTKVQNKLRRLRVTMANRFSFADMGELSHG